MIIIIDDGCGDTSEKKKHRFSTLNLFGGVIFSALPHPSGYINKYMCVVHLDLIKVPWFINYGGQVREKFGSTEKWHDAKQ